MVEKTEERLAMEKEASALGIQGNIPGFKDDTLAKKIAEAKDPEAAAKAAKEKEDKAKAAKKSSDTICVGKNACKGKFGIAGKVFAPGEDIVLDKLAMSNRNVSARVTHGKKIGMIK